MAHPPNFDPDDPVLATFRKICMAFPGANEKVSHGRPCFFTKKIFAIYGATTKGPDAPRYDQSAVFLADEDERVALEQHDRVFVPAYWGPYGWLGYDLTGTPDWDEVAELVEDSYRQIATKTLIKQLNEQT